MAVRLPVRNTFDGYFGRSSVHVFQKKRLVVARKLEEL